MKKHMKLSIIALLAGLLIFSSVGCAKTTTSRNLSDYNKYVESVGNNVECRLRRTTAIIHSYFLLTSYIKKQGFTALLFYI